MASSQLETEAGIPLIFEGASEQSDPPLVFGGAAFSYHQNSDEFVKSHAKDTLKLALSYGIKAIDTSPYYGNSETVIGGVLKELAEEFPRSSYTLITKCGRFGQEKDNRYFDYSPDAIRASISSSLVKLKTPHLDLVYLHDVEFVCEPTDPKIVNDVAPIPGAEYDESWGLLHPEKKGDGDEKILKAIEVLRELKDKGLIRAVGISGYPLPDLLRLSILILHKTGKPLDALLSYGQLTLQNKKFESYIPLFREKAKIGRLFSASPLNMGFFTTDNVPEWHPAPQALLDLKDKVAEDATLKDAKLKLPDLATGYSMRVARDAGNLPTVIGLSKPDEVHSLVRSWRDVNAKVETVEGTKRIEAEERAIAIFKGDKEGWYGWSHGDPIPSKH